MAKKPHAREAFDREQIARAAYFTACRFIGRGRYDRLEAHSEDAAIAAAVERWGKDGRTMIYAVTRGAYQNSIHIRNV